MWRGSRHVDQPAGTLNQRETQEAVQFIKETFSSLLADYLGLSKVTAPLFVQANSGLNDDLSGREKPVSFTAPDLGDTELEVVQSLAKWKRYALREYGFGHGEGLYADMQAIRKDESLDSIHSLLVDQWDWERVISVRERCPETLLAHVHKIYDALCRTQERLQQRWPQFRKELPTRITVISAPELEDRYPMLTPEQREREIVQQKGAVFVSQIGGPLASGAPHDQRAPDYDDWRLNGDILVWHPILGKPLELSSMGIRVDATAMRHQLEQAGCLDWMELPYHQAVLNDDLPQTIGGGIGQSRLCMFLLGKKHIGEVQVGVWPQQFAGGTLGNDVRFL